MDAICIDSYWFRCLFGSKVNQFHLEFCSFLYDLIPAVGDFLASLPSVLHRHLTLSPLFQGGGQRPAVNYLVLHQISPSCPLKNPSCTTLCILWAPCNSHVFLERLCEHKASCEQRKVLWYKGIWLEIKCQPSPAKLWALNGTWEERHDTVRILLWTFMDVFPQTAAKITVLAHPTSPCAHTDPLHTHTLKNRCACTSH